MKKSKLSQLLSDVQKRDSLNGDSPSFETMSVSSGLAQSQFGALNKGCSNSGCQSGSNHGCTNTNCGNGTNNGRCTNEQ